MRLLKVRGLMQDWFYFSFEPDEPESSTLAYYFSVDKVGILRVGTCLWTL